jgi:predicted permease
MTSRFDRWFRPDEYARREIDAEIDAHLSARIDHLIAQGVSPEQARDEALRKFGDVAAARAALLDQAHSRQRRLDLRERLNRLMQDVRFVARSLARTPAFSLGVVLTLALGLGINAAVFRVADQVLLRPPEGVDRPHELRRMEAAVSLGGGAAQRATTFSYPDVERVRASNAFASITVATPPRLAIDGGGRELGIAYVDTAYFPTLGVSMARGRGFDDREGTPGTAPRVAVVSHGYWRRALGSATLDGGPLVTLGEREFRVIAVAERGFAGSDLNPVDVWLPLGDAELGRGFVNGVEIPWYRSEGLRPLRALGRLTESGTESIASQRLSAALQADPTVFGPSSRRESTLHPIVPLGDGSTNAAANAMLFRLTAVAAVVMLIACGNAINLLLARGLRRAREIGIRFAVGASRARVMRLLIVESLVLAIVGAGAAVLSGYWTADALRRLVFPDSRWDASPIDERTLAFTALMALTAGLLAGLIPALQSTRAGALAGFREGRTPGGRGGRTRAALIVAQTALSLALLVGCGLLVRSLMRLNAVDLGFDPSGLVMVSAGRSGLDADGMQQIAERLRGVPQVRGVATASIAPFGASSMMDITVPGSSFVPQSDYDNPYYAEVTDNYFGVMGMKILQGRGLLASDAASGEPVAVVNQAMARRYWGSSSPFASCILSSRHGCARVVGIVSDVRDAPGGAAPPMRFYLPLSQAPRTMDALVVRTGASHVAPVAVAVRTAVATPRPPTVEAVSDRISRELHPWWTAMLLFTVLGALALALACVGIYGVMSYLVAERLHEMGIRLALGASGPAVVRLVLGNGLRLIVAGSALGILASLGLGRLLQALLFQVSAYEPLIYALAVLSLALLATLAMLPAALRASRVDPVDALRVE